MFFNMKNISLYRLYIIIVWIGAYIIISTLFDYDPGEAMPAAIKIVFPLFFFLSIYELILYRKQKEQTDFIKIRVPLDGFFAVKMSSKLEGFLRIINPMVWLILWLITFFYL